MTALLLPTASVALEGKLLPLLRRRLTLTLQAHEGLASLSFGIFTLLF